MHPQHFFRDASHELCKIVQTAPVVVKSYGLGIWSNVSSVIGGYATKTARCRLTSRRLVSTFGVFTSTAPPAIAMFAAMTKCADWEILGNFRSGKCLVGDLSIG